MKQKKKNTYLCSFLFFHPQILTVLHILRTICPHVHFSHHFTFLSFVLLMTGNWWDQNLVCFRAICINTQNTRIPILEITSALIWWKCIKVVFHMKIVSYQDFLMIPGNCITTLSLTTYTNEHFNDMYFGHLHTLHDNVQLHWKHHI